MTEAVLDGYALASVDPQRFAEFVARARAEGQKITARGHSLVLRQLMKNGTFDAAVIQSREMRHDGFVVPSFAVSELFRVACDKGRAAELLGLAFLPLQADDVTTLLEHCLRCSDLALAERVALCATEASVTLCPRAASALLQVYCHAGLHDKVCSLYSELLAAGVESNQSMYDYFLESASVLGLS
jgi:pentatricopeptide repeat protein